MPLATLSFGELLLLVFEFFLLFAWIWILITVIFDLFRDHELSGVAKAVWVFFLVFLPVPRRPPLPDRPRRRHARPCPQRAGRHQKALRRVRPRPGPGRHPAEELHKLNELKEKGALSQSEFDQAKAKLLGS